MPPPVSQVLRNTESSRQTKARPDNKSNPETEDQAGDSQREAGAGEAEQWLLSTREDDPAPTTHQPLDCCEHG